MKLCEHCNSVFDEVKLRKEYMGEHFGFPAYEEVACCPNCGADGLVEVQKCEKCGEYFESYELDDGFCELCRQQRIADDRQRKADRYQKRQRIKNKIVTGLWVVLIVGSAAAAIVWR